MTNNVVDLFSWTGERSADKVLKAQIILHELLKGIVDTLKQAKQDPAVLDALIVTLEKALE